MPVQPSARIGQGHAARRADEQGHSHLVFQQLQLTAERWLRDSKLARRARQAAHIGNDRFVSGSKRLLINGEWRDAISGKEIDCINPATGEVIAKIAQGDAADIDNAVAAARRAFEGEWSRWKPHDRQKLLLRLHSLVDQHWKELALIETLDMGAPLGRTRGLKDLVSKFILSFSSHAYDARVETAPNSLAGDFHTFRLKAPLGVIGTIIPWNMPLVSQWWTIGAVLATGCTSVIKPAEDASLSVLRVAELLMEAGMPPGVINFVTGYGPEAGAALAAHPQVDRITFTGSAATGRKIVEYSAGNLKRVQLELGGKSPDIVFADADLDMAVPGAAMGVYLNSGQACVAGSRLLVQRSIMEEFLHRLKAFTSTIKVGDPLHSETVLGPLISNKQLSRVMSYMDIGSTEGAQLECGGQRMGGDLANGYYVAPTVFSGVNNSMRIAREEIFGPVVSLIAFDDLDDALRIANDTDYGLGGGVWTRSLSTAHKTARAIKAGTIWVNSYSVFEPEVGAGGYKQSGYGWKGAAEMVVSFTYQKAVYMNLG